MINAHIEQSSVYWAQHENRLYKFRILDLSEPFCERRTTYNNTPLSRSCDNVAQRLKQLERRHKRTSEPFLSRLQLPVRPCHQEHRKYNRTKSLPTDLHKLVKHEISIDDLKRDQNINTHGENGQNSLRKNGLIRDNDGHSVAHNHEENQTCFTMPRTERTANMKDNCVLDEVLVEEHCTTINSNLRELSTRFGRLQLEAKSKEELISIILELQDALRLSTDD